MSPKKSNRKDRSRYHVPNLERALEMLELLAGRSEGMTLAEIVDRLSIPRNSAYRIAATLQDKGYLIRDEENKRFALSRKLLAVGYAAVGERNLVEKSIDIMRDLRDAIRETVCIGVLFGAEGVALDQVPGSHPFKFLIDPGLRFPLHCNAPGKALLAFLPEKEREKLLSGMKLKRWTERTITKRGDLIKELESIRRCGYAVDRAEMTEGCHCVGAPVLDHREYPVAAVWATGPSDRLREDMFDSVGQEVVEHTRRISMRLGNGLL